MIISFVVAATDDGVIGKEGGLPWYLPSELARFKQITMGHPIIMGRKTHESIGRALPGRLNIVITHDKKYEAPGCSVVPSLDEAIKAAAGADEAFIIGGQSVFEEAMPRVERIYLTRVHADIKGDKYFRFDQTGWRLLKEERHPKDEKNKHDFDFLLYERLKA